jgi:hypothetical protein
MSNWKQKIHDMEIAPPKKMWEEIEQKRQGPRWVKWGVMIPVLAVCIALTFQAFEKQASYSTLSEQPILEIKSAEPINNSAKDPIKSQQKMLTSQPSAAIFTSEEPIAEPNQSNTSFPYNGRIVTKQNEPNTQEFSINSAENITSPVTMEEVIEEIKPEIENTWEDSSFAVSHEEIEIPNIFSPNGDGWNDEFTPSRYLPEGSQLLEWKLYYNGQFVQSWKSDAPWQGLDAAGFPMKSGLYQYQIYFTNSKDEIKRREGSISIQR